MISLAQMKQRRRRTALGVLLCALPLAVALGSGSVEATPAPPDDSVSATPAPAGSPELGVQAEWLIPIPVGCPVPDQADAVFTGTMIGKDDITQVVRFRIDQLRAGSVDPWAINGLIDVRYGPDYRFLSTGEQYLIGTRLDPAFGVPVSTVRPPEPTFGGNDVVGVDDIAVDCPALDDPTRTLQVDGTSIDSGVLSLITDDRRLLLATLAVPTAIVFAVLLALVLLRAFGALAFRGVFQLGRAAVTPVPDHRAVRVRSHRPRDVDDGAQVDDGDQADDGDSESDEVPAPTGQ